MTPVNESDIAAARAAFDIPAPGIERARRCVFCSRLCPGTVCFACSQSVVTWPDDETTVAE